jgi:hypothetical protein
MSETAEQIRQRMEVVRHDLVDDLADLVQSAKQTVDWREYVKRYPWACMRIAAGVGFFAVPARLEIVRADAETLLELAKQDKLVVHSETTSPKSNGLAGALMALAAKAPMRGAVRYLAQRTGAANPNSK